MGFLNGKCLQKKPKKKPFLFAQNCKHTKINLSSFFLSSEGLPLHKPSAAMEIPAALRWSPGFFFFQLLLITLYQYNPAFSLAEIRFIHAPKVRCAASKCHPRVEFVTAVVCLWSFLWSRLFGDGPACYCHTAWDLKRKWGARTVSHTQVLISGHCASIQQ